MKMPFCVSGLLVKAHHLRCCVTSAVSSVTNHYIHDKTEHARDAHLSQGLQCVSICRKFTRFLIIIMEISKYKLHMFG